MGNYLLLALDFSHNHDNDHVNEVNYEESDCTPDINVANEEDVNRQVKNDGHQGDQVPNEKGRCDLDFPVGLCGGCH